MQDTIAPDIRAGAAQEDVGIPELVLIERQDGSVAGAVVHEMRSGYHVTFADQFAEPDEVERGIRILNALDAGEQYGTWVMARGITAASLDTAIANSPETSAGQKFVFLYRNNEWLWGIWNNPDHPDRQDVSEHVRGLRLMSVADFHGTRVSAAKRATRSGLDEVRSNMALAGPYEVLEAAIEQLNGSPRSADTQDYEAHPAVRHLCDWWNRNAPEGSREAGYARLYVWKEIDATFEAGDPEEPARQADQFDASDCYALFERPGMPTVAAQFYRGRRFNQEDRMGVTTFLANGNTAWSIGADLHEVDEASYSLIGLERLAARDEFAG
jgi:hypothetical protein